MSSIPSRRHSTILVILAGLQLLVLSSVWPRFVSPNEASRVYAAHAFVTRGTFSIDPELARWGSIDDVSAFGGRHYSNKAPGLIWAAVPVVAVVEAIAPGAPLWLEQYLCRVALVSSISLVAALLLASWTPVLGTDAPAAGWSVFILLFASGFGVYAGTFFSHAWSGGLLLAAAWLLLGPGERFGERGELAAGFLIAVAAVSEYPAAVPGAVLGLAAAWGDRRRLVRLILGGLAPLAALAWYDHVCFGSALTLSSRLEALPRYHRLAVNTFFGFSPPHAAALAGLLFSPLEGLFFFFPVLLPALVAPVVAWRNGRRRLAWVLAAGVWLLPVVMSGYREWTAGATYGPRYLVMAVPFAVLGLALLRGRAARWWITGTLLPSALVTLAGRLVPPFAIDDTAMASTFRGWVLPALRHGLWNLPPGAHGPVAAGVSVTVAVGVWLVALGVAWSRWASRPPFRRAVGAAILTAAVVTAQLGLGRVTHRQRGWFRYVRAAFSTLGRNRP